MGAESSAPGAGPDAVAAKTATTISFTSHPNTGVKGVAQSVPFVVTPTPDGGMVDLEVDGAVIDTQPVVSGAGSFQWTPAATGTLALRLLYGGTSLFASSETSASPVIELPSPTVTIEASANPVPRLTSVTFTATVTPNPGGGTITWRDDFGTLQAALPVDADGRGQYTTSFATAGDHWIYADFSGTADWTPRGGTVKEIVTSDAIILTLSVPENPSPPDDVVVTATLVPNPGSGFVRFERSGALLGDVPVDSSGQAHWDFGAQVPGAVSIHAEYFGNEVYGHATDDLDFAIWDTSAVSLAANRTHATVGELPVVLSSVVARPTGRPNERVEWLDEVGGAVVALGPVAVNPYTGGATFSSSSLRVGIHTIRAHYMPGDNAWTFDAASAPVTVTVTADTAVHATFSSSLATFYPAKDGFRDTTRLGGVLDEKATVTIRVYSSSGTLRRTWSLGTKAPGAYSVSWNGLTSSGAQVAAGTYKVTAAFKDTSGNTRTITTTTTVSWRKAVWKSVSVLRNADQGSWWVSGGGAIYYSPIYTHGLILDSGPMVPDCTACGWVGGRFVFGLASSGVLEYRKIYIEVRGHGFSDREHPGTISLYSPKRTYTHETPLYPYDDPGVVSGVPVPTSHVDGGRRVTAWIRMTQAWGDAYDLRYLKLTYEYAVWA
jgi:hypothetical protein